MKALRNEGKGWSVIAKELGFKLGPVVREVQHVRQALRAERERLKDQLKAEKAVKKSTEKAGQTFGEGGIA